MEIRREIFGIQNNRFRHWFNLTNKFNEQGKEIRRIIHGYWKFYKDREMFAVKARKDTRRSGRFKIIPEYTLGDEKIDWIKFRNSYMRGKARENEFIEILTKLKKDLDVIISEINSTIKKANPYLPNNPVRAIAIGGSTYLGPRQKDLFDNPDVDVYVILDSEVYKKYMLSGGKPIASSAIITDRKYEYVFLGTSEKDRPSFLPVHVPACPNAIIYSRYSVSEMENLENEIMINTITRTNELKGQLNLWNLQLLKTKQGAIID